MSVWPGKHFHPASERVIDSSINWLHRKKLIEHLNRCKYHFCFTSQFLFLHHNICIPDFHISISAILQFFTRQVASHPLQSSRRPQTWVRPVHNKTKRFVPVYLSSKWKIGNVKALSARAFIVKIMILSWSHGSEQPAIAWFFGSPYCRKWYQYVGFTCVSIVSITSIPSSILSYPPCSIFVPSMQHKCDEKKNSRVNGEAVPRKRSDQHFFTSTGAVVSSNFWQVAGALPWTWRRCHLMLRELIWS